MKKYVIGALFGAFLSLSVSVYAEEVKSLVGAVIQGEFPVKVNGQDLTNKAIVVDGTSYLPVREFGEKLGMLVKFDADLGIELVKPDQPTVPPVPPQPVQPKPKLESIEEGIKNISDLLKMEEWVLKVAQENNGDPATIAQIKSKVDAFKAQIAELETQKTELLKQ